VISTEENLQSLGKKLNHGQTRNIPTKRLETLLEKIFKEVDHLSFLNLLT
jgi:hypothetical protein